MTDGAPAADPIDLRAEWSLFDRVPGVYAFCREHLFRDDTERIAGALWPVGRPEPGALVLELGCGPGLYARRLATRFAEITVVGIDRSRPQLERARSRAARAELANCLFELGDATDLRHPDASVDAVVLSRLLAVVEDRARVVAEVHRVLRPGGRCFVAEPRSSLRAGVPIAAMRVASWLGSAAPGPRPGAAGADRVEVLGRADFATLIRSRPWQRLSEWADATYQYALLEKPGAPAR